MESVCARPIAETDHNLLRLRSVDFHTFFWQGPYIYINTEGMIRR